MPNIDRMTGLLTFGSSGGSGGGGTSGGGKFYECASVGDGTWSGHEWVLADGVYSKSAAVTPGLSWTSVKPVVGKSYSGDALVQAVLYKGVLAPTDYIAYYPMASADEFNGSVGSGIAFVKDEFGVEYATFSGSSKIITSADLPYPGNPFSIVVSLNPRTTDFRGIVGFGADANNHNTLYIDGGDLYWGDWVRASAGVSAPVMASEWATYAVVFDGQYYTLYGYDGVPHKAEPETQLNSYSNWQMSIGGAPGWNDNLYTGDMRDLYIFGRALSEAEIRAMYN